MEDFQLVKQGIRELVTRACRAIKLNRSAALKFQCIGSQADSFAVSLVFWALLWGMLYATHLAQGHLQDSPEVDLEKD